MPGGAALSFTAGYGQWAANPDANPVITEPLSGQVTLSAPAAVPTAVPAIATRTFDSQNNTHLGSDRADDGRAGSPCLPRSWPWRTRSRPSPARA